MDVGRFGALGVSLFLGGRAYYILGERRFSFESETVAFVMDPVRPTGTDLVFAGYEVEVDPWLFRGHVGIRMNWLGSGD